MFGYVTIDRDELKGKDLTRYRAYYCGVCHDLRHACGQLSRMTLTYDMTFLAVLLTALYKEDQKTEDARCLLHPARKQPVIRNACTSYAADMNILLTWNNLQDDWEDEHSLTARTAARALRSAYLKTAAKYPEQTKAIRRYLKKLHEAERRKEGDVEYAAGLTGEMLSAIFSWREDIWQRDLRRLGFYLGKFIYLCDAWDDREKDEKNGCYNPFLSAPRTYSEEEIAQILTMMAAEATRAFERLPVIEDADILRNILYSGIWVKYRTKRNADSSTAGKSTEDSTEETAESNTVETAESSTEETAESNTVETAESSTEETAERTTEKNTGNNTESDPEHD